VSGYRYITYLLQAHLLCIVPLLLLLLLLLLHRPAGQRGAQG
jgi:hypothetical protein